SNDGRENESRAEERLEATASELPETVEVTPELCTRLITAGRPRPDLLSRCQPATNAANAPVFGLANASICTQSDIGILRDGFRSFFSGHSSLSFAGLGFLFWYLSGKLHLFDLRGHAGKAWISVVPLMGATLVAISRTMDYRRECTRINKLRRYSPRVPRESDEAGKPASPDATPAPPSLTADGSGDIITPGPDDTVQRKNPDVSDTWRQGSRRGGAGAQDDEETV
ncbi:hypothetical protein FRC00_013942, partial [Tulasnella sp. 408]